MLDPLDPPDLLGRYRWCRVGFSLTALACVVMAFHAAGVTFFFLTWHPSLRQFFNSGDWLLAATSVISWSSLLGCLALAPCWPEPYWRRRVSILIALSVISVVVWLLRHAVRFGLASEPIPHTELMVHASLGLRWVWLAILAGLAADVLVHLGDDNAPRLRAGILATITAGVAFWILTLLIELMPGLAAPRRPRAFVAIWMQLLGFWGLYCAAGFSTAVLVLMGSRECKRLIRDLKREEERLPLTSFDR